MAIARVLGVSAPRWSVLLLVALLLGTGCATLPPPSGSRGVLSCGGEAVPEDWPDLSSSDEELLGPFLKCTSPAEFIELQRGVDMPRLVEALGDWSAVRLGALGPLREGADILNRKRAAFLVSAAEDYSAPEAEVFALFVIHTSFTDELHEVLVLLGKDKRLGQTLGRMPAVREALRLRGVNLSLYADRNERWGDVGRGLARAAEDARRTIPAVRDSLGGKLYAQARQLPPAYQRALDEVLNAELEQRATAGNIALGCLDELTFGVPLGFYNLVAGTCHGVYSLSQGQYEQATRELSAAAVLVALYAGGKAVRFVSEGGVGAGWARVGPLPMPELGFEGLAEVADRLWERLGDAGLLQLARYIQAHREAALLVYEGGEAGAVALYEARGDVAKAQAHLSEARPESAGTGGARGGVGKALGGVASLVDASSGLTAEVVEAKLLRTELEAPGPRLPADVKLLSQQRPSVDSPPPGVPEGSGLWKEYVEYRQRRLAELEQGRKLKGPLRWEAYGWMRGAFARGLAFERAMTALLRADAELPRAQRRWLKDFHQPRVETYVGVAKEGQPGVRFADVLVIEEAPPEGQLPRVESFSFKSRDLRLLTEQALKAQMTSDAREALKYYGETLNIRRPVLKYLGPAVEVRRVRLIYEGGVLKPENTRALEETLLDVQQSIRGVEVLVQ